MTSHLSPPHTLRALPAAIWALGFGQLFMDASSELVHSLVPVFMTSVLRSPPDRRPLTSRFQRVRLVKDQSEWRWSPPEPPCSTANDSCHWRGSVLPPPDERH